MGLQAGPRPDRARERGARREPIARLADQRRAPLGGGALGDVTEQATADAATPHLWQHEHARPAQL